MKKIFLILFIVLLSISGCKNASNKIEIEFWTLQLSPAFDDYFAGIIKQYETEHPGIKVKWVDIPYDAVIQKLMSSVAAGNPPDAVNLSADFLSKFNGMGALYNLKESLDTSTFNIYLKNALDECSYNNKITALPWYLNTYVLLYNKKLWNDAGFSQKDLPKTFDQLLDVIKKYKDKTGKYCFFWNIGKDSYLPMMLGSEGIDMTDKNMTMALFNSTESMGSLSKWINLYKDGYLPKDCIIKQGSEILESYQAKQCAMIFTGPVFLKRIKDNAIEVYNETDVLPAIIGKTGKHELAEMCISVLNTSKHKKEAADFIAFVTNSKNQLAFCKLAAIYPSTYEALNNPFFSKDDHTLESKGRITGGKELLSAVKLRKYLDHPKFDLLRDSFDEAIQNAALNRMSIKDALNNSVNEWNYIFKEENE